MPARSAAEAYVTGLAPYLNLLLQQRQLGQQQAYQTGELGVQRQQAATQQQQVEQTSAYQRGQLAIGQQNVAIAQQARKAQAIQLVVQAANADPLNMTGAYDQALRYAQSVGVGQQDLQGAGVQQPGAQLGTAPQGQPTATPQGQPSAAPGMGVLTPTSDLSTAIRNGVQGPKLYDYMPIPLRNEIQQILSGQTQPPSLSARNPQARQLMMLASAVDPSFDATQYGMRFQTAKAFATGQQGQAIKSINQTMNHAGHLLQNIEQLNNYGGPFPTAVNAVSNYLGEHVAGQATQGTFEQTAGALAAEMRKVFAAAGGGSLTELKQWEESLPVNGSPFQQRSYLQNGMSLLEGAINSLQDQYRRGFGANANVEGLISPRARAMLQTIKNMDPRTGHIMQGGGGQPIFARNPQTGERIVSQDGGQSWQPAR